MRARSSALSHTLIAAAVAATAAAGCAAKPAAAPRGPAGWRVVDLTWPLSSDVPTFEGKPTFASKVEKTVAADGYFLSTVTVEEHTGTHVDAPAHFAPGTAAVDQIPAEQLVGAAAVIDVTAAVAKNPDYTVTVDDLRAWEAKHGALGPRSIVLVHTGWAARWADPARYRNPDAQGVMHFPGVSIEAAKYLTEHGVRGIGIDTLSTDPGPSTTFAEHKQFLAAGGVHIENVAHLDQLPAAGATVVVAPLPVRGGSGAPARVLALIPAP